ncbi:MAG: aminotransferase class V-fold PLP-dependent enzyme, partial [Patescibacteria group bacterium]
MDAELLYIPTRQGVRPYINFDNAASTPPLKGVMQMVNDYMPWYSSVHRGNGLKSRLSTKLYEEARQIIREFVGANPDEHVVIFGKNTTE